VGAYAGSTPAYVQLIRKENSRKEALMRIEWPATLLSVLAEFILVLLALMGTTSVTWLVVTQLVLLAVQFMCIIVGRPHPRAVNEKKGLL
jgi:hypothetical protein